ncbi:MAG: HlyC/CorC family transporter [Clostridiales bacterium]|jgi:CBS domain containing-hemolysin-like protein|nr:HlyC/CorC family transporter [Clostridiales bacterium]
MELQIIAMIILVTLSAIYSATEMAYTSLNRSRLKNASEKGAKHADSTFKLLENYDMLLSTILVANNIVNITLASIAAVFFLKIFPITGATISTVVVTVVVLVFGEVSPKTIARRSPERFAMAIAPFIRFTMIILTPINFFFSMWKKLLGLIFKSDEDRRMTEEELLTIVEEAEQEGGINEQESELIRSAIEFNDLEAGDILTPRVDIEAIRIGTTNEEIETVFIETGYSRLPVYHDSVDMVTGVIHQKDFYNMVLHKHKPLESIIKPVRYVPPTIKISNLLKELQLEKAHMAIVIDEFGGTAGIVTMEDIIEELVGDIWDEHDEVVEEFIKISENTFQVLGGYDLEELFDYFDMPLDETDSSTISGWVMEQLGRIPAEGDFFEYENMLVTVTKTDNNRVIEVIIKLIEEEKADTE